MRNFLNMQNFIIIRKQHRVNRCETTTRDSYCLYLKTIRYNLADDHLNISICGCIGQILEEN